MCCFSGGLKVTGLAPTAGSRPRECAPHKADFTDVGHAEVSTNSSCSAGEALARFRFWEASSSFYGGGERKQEARCVASREG